MDKWLKAARKDLIMSDEGVYDSTAWIITAGSYLMSVAKAVISCVDLDSIKNLVTMYIENAALLALLFL